LLHLHTTTYESWDGRGVLGALGYNSRQSYFDVSALMLPELWIPPWEALGSWDGVLKYKPLFEILLLAGIGCTLENSILFEHIHNIP